MRSNTHTLMNAHSKGPLTWLVSMATELGPHNPVQKPLTERGKHGNTHTKCVYDTDCTEDGRKHSYIIHRRSISALYLSLELSNPFLLALIMHCSLGTDTKTERGSTYQKIMRGNVCARARDGGNLIAINPLLNIPLTTKLL